MVCISGGVLKEGHKWGTGDKQQFNDRLALQDASLNNHRLHKGRMGSPRARQSLNKAPAHHNKQNINTYFPKVIFMPIHVHGTSTSCHAQRVIDNLGMLFGISISNRIIIEGKYLLLSASQEQKACDCNCSPQEPPLEHLFSSSWLWVHVHDCSPLLSGVLCWNLPVDADCPGCPPRQLFAIGVLLREVPPTIQNHIWGT